MVSDVARGPIVAPLSPPQVRAMAVLWNSCLVQTETSGLPTLWPMDFPREQRIEMESFANPGPWASSQPE